MYTYFKDLEELKACCPIENGIWNKEILKGYMIYCCVKGFGGYIDGFMAGSDCQIGAAVYISRMDRELLRRKKGLLLQAQSNEVHWKRPFRENEPLDWL